MSISRSPSHPWRDFDLVQTAAHYAAVAHRDDLRKGTAIPYLSHLWSVAALVLEHEGDDEQVAAALLHDVVEDQGGAARLADVRQQFGDGVAGLVEALSDSVVDTSAGEVKADWRERKEQYLGHLVAADARTALVSACDKLHNARCIVADLRVHGDKLWVRFNASNPRDQLWYYDELVKTLQPPRVPAALAQELARTVEFIRGFVSPEA